MSKSTPPSVNTYDRCQGRSCLESNRRECCNSPGSSVSVVQQMVSSCVGASVTSLLSGHVLHIPSAVLSASPSLSLFTRIFHFAFSVTPMDVVKIRLQRQAKKVPSGQCFYYYNGLMDHLCRPCGQQLPCEWFQRPGTFSGTIDAFVKISRNEGVRSLWSGLSPTLLMALPATVFYFTVYDSLLADFRKRICYRRTYKSDSFAPPEWTAPVVAGVLARSIAVTVVSPLEMVRTKMQSERMPISQLASAVRSSYETMGIRSLYLGWAPSLLRDVPFSAIYWGGVEYFKSLLQSIYDKKETNFWISFASASMAGALAAVVTTPFDVVKTNRQITIGSGEAVQRLSVKQSFQDLVRRGGYQALFAGVTPRVVKVAPSCAIMLGSYDFFKLFFERRNLTH